MKFWNFIKNEQNEDEVELRISGEIMDDTRAWIYEWFGIPVASPNAFRRELAKYKGKNIKVWIDSFGGSVFAGAGIYNALKNHDGKVTTIIDGKAMSAASVIAMAGDVIYISLVGIIMIHNPWSEAVGEAKDMRHAADVLDEVKETIINAYQYKTGVSREKISEMMDNETFMSAKTALNEGFADEILHLDSDKGNTQVENDFMFSRLSIKNSMAHSMQEFFEVARNNKSDSQPPAQAVPAVSNISNQEMGEETMYKTIEELKNACPELVQQIENAARDEGKNAGVQEERTRIQDISKIAKNISPDLVTKAMFEEPINAQQLAFQAMQQDNDNGQSYLANVQADNQTSGVEEIEGSSTDTTVVDQKPKSIDGVIKAVGSKFDLMRRGVKING